MGKKIKNRDAESGNLDLLTEKIEKCFENGNFRKAAVYCKKAVKTIDTNTNNSIAAKIYFSWVLASMKLGDYKAIDTIIDKAQNRMGTYLDLIFFRIMAAKGVDDYETTMKYAGEYEKLHNNTNPNTDRHLKQSYNSLDEVLWIRGEAALKINETDKALEYMKRSLEFKPDNHHHRVEIAERFVEHQKDDSALDIIEEGIKLFPDYLTLKNARVMILGQLENYEIAEKHAKEILLHHPDSPDTLNNLGVIYEKQGLTDLAKKQFELTIKADPQNEYARKNLDRLNKLIDGKPQTISAAMIVKNEEKLLPGCLESIKDLVDELIIVDTGSTDRTMDIARKYGAKIYEHPWQNDFSFHRNQSIDYATGDWILIIDADEELYPEEHEKIKMIIKRKDVDGVSFIVLNEIKKGRVGYLHSTRMFRSHKGTKYDGIVHNQLKMTGQVKQTNFRVMHHGYGLSEEKMYKKSRRTEALLLKQLEETPGEIFAHFNLAQLYRGESKCEECLKHAKFVIDKTSFNDLEKRPIYIMALDQAGCALVGLARYEEAIEIFNKALDYNKDYLDSTFNLGFAYMDMKKYDKAEKYFLKYLKLKSVYSPIKDKIRVILNNLTSEHVAYYSLGFISFSQEKYEQALEYFNKALNYVDDFENMHYLMARCYREKNNYKKIIEHCDKAVNFEHENWEVWMLKGEACLNINDSKSARDCFDKVLEHKPDEKSVMIGMIGVTSLEKSPTELLEYIDGCLQKSPLSPQILASKGDVLFKLGKYDTALQSYVDSNKQSPYDYKVLNNLGNCYLKTQNYASAVECYQSALKENSEFAAGYKNIGIALINQKKISEAIEYLEHYLSKKYDDYEVHATIGDLYYNTKQYNKAILHYEVYLKVNPSSIDALIRLSDCYLNLGKMQAAVLGYKTVLLKDSSNETVRNRLNELNDFIKPVITK